MSGHNPYDLARHSQRERDQRDLRNRNVGQAVEDWRWLLADERGRRIAMRLLEQAGIDDPHESTNAMQVQRTLGRRDLGLWLQHELRSASSVHFMTMLQESIHEQDHAADRR